MTVQLDLCVRFPQALEAHLLSVSITCYVQVGLVTYEVPAWRKLESLEDRIHGTQVTAKICIAFDEFFRHMGPLCALSTEDEY